MTTVHLDAHGMVNLPRLMELTKGNPAIKIGLIDGPVALDPSGFDRERISLIGESKSDAALEHGTFVAGVLAGICPGCTVLVRPIFQSAALKATLPELALAIVDCVNAGARVLNISAALDRPWAPDGRSLAEALDFAASRGAIAVFAAGNRGSVGGSTITSRSGVIAVAAYDRRSQPMVSSNFGAAIGRYGLGAPGERVAGVNARGETVTNSGTSVAAPFVTGAIALLWSLFPKASAAEVRCAVTQCAGSRRATVVPPLLDSWAAYGILSKRR